MYSLLDTAAHPVPPDPLLLLLRHVNIRSNSDDAILRPHLLRRRNCINFLRKMPLGDNTLFRELTFVTHVDGGTDIRKARTNIIYNKEANELWGDIYNASFKVTYQN